MKKNIQENMCSKLIKLTWSVVWKFIVSRYEAKGLRIMTPKNCCGPQHGNIVCHGMNKMDRVPTMYDLCML